MSPSEFLALWGPADFARLDVAAQGRVNLPTRDVEFLIEAGLPRAAGLYGIGFAFPPTHIPTLATVDRRHAELAMGHAGALVLGGNDSCYICVSPGEEYQIISIARYSNESLEFVNSSILQLAETLLVMRDAAMRAYSLSAIADPMEFKSSIHVALQRIDARVTAEGQGWWLGMLTEMVAFRS